MNTCSCTGPYEDALSIFSLLFQYPFSHFTYINMHISVKGIQIMYVINLISYPLRYKYISHQNGNYCLNRSDGEFDRSDCERTGQIVKFWI